MASGTEKISLTIAVIAILVAIFLGVQNTNLKSAQASLSDNLQSCEASKTSLDGQMKQLNADLTAARNESETLRAENEQLKTRKPGTKKPARPA